MPTAVDYTLWGSWFGEKADEMTVLLNGPLELSGEDTITGGLLALTVDVPLRSAAANATAAASRFRDLADECTRRAEICEAYDAGMRQYDSAMEAYRRELVEYADGIGEAEMSGQPFYGTPPRRPAEPRRPAPWVERLR